MKLPPRFYRNFAPTLVATGAAILAIGLPLTAHATVIDGSSSAFGESIDLTVTPLLPILGGAATVTSGPMPTVGGTAPAPYSYTGMVASVSVPGISTGVLTVDASSNVDGSAGTRTASSDATVNSLSIGIGALTIAATTIQSTASVTGDYGALAATGTTTIEGLVLDSIPLVAVTPTVDDVLLDALGIKVEANEQTPGGDGTNASSILVDALDVSLTNVFGTYDGVTGLINGDIIIDQSQAFLAAVSSSGSSSSSSSSSGSSSSGSSSGGGSPVPEPPTILILAAGLLSFFGMARLRNGNLIPGSRAA